MYTAARKPGDNATTTATMGGSTAKPGPKGSTTPKGSTSKEPKTPTGAKKEESKTGSMVKSNTVKKLGDKPTRGSVMKPPTTPSSRNPNHRASVASFS